jgi:hypothetical protein
MTPAQARLVQTSFATLAPRADTVAVAFYDRLFALDPALRRFPGAMAAQRRKLMAMLAMAAPALDRPATLEGQLGEGFDAPLEAAWAACYARVSVTMRTAARQAALAAAA